MWLCKNDRTNTFKKLKNKYSNPPINTLENMAQITTYTVDPAKRRILTVTNMEELGITDALIAKILANTDAKEGTLFQRYQVDSAKRRVKDAAKKDISLSPIGMSINDKIFGDFPNPNAAQRGWMSYIEIGAPLFEERSNIIQPVADVLSTRTYDNRSYQERTFSDTINFTIGNTINWSLSGGGHADFGGKIGGQLQGQISGTIEAMLQASLSNSLTGSVDSTLTLNNGTNTSLTNSFQAIPEGTGSSNSTTTGTTSSFGTANHAGVATTVNATGTGSGKASFTGTGTATGSGELSAALGLSLSGTISGTVTTSWSSTSMVSGVISSNSRVETLATQRRQVKQFTYEIPITFGGYVALNYPELVLTTNDPDGPLPGPETPAKILPVKITTLGLAPVGGYRPKGMVETVSALDVNHTIFDTKTLNRDNDQKFGTNRPHNL